MIPRLGGGAARVIAGAWVLAVGALFLAGWGARLAPFARLLPILATWGAILLAAWAVGAIVVLQLETELAAPGAWRLAFGFALISWLWLALGTVVLLREWTAWTVLVLLAGLGLVLRLVRWHVQGRRLASLLLEPGERRPRDLPRDVLLPLGLALAGLLVVLPMALTPPASTDELTYHLAVPKWWCEAGRLVSFAHVAHAAFPMQVELLYTWALLLGSAVAAKLVHLALGLAAVVMAAGESRAKRGALAGAMTAAVLLTTPVFLLNMSWAWADAATALYVLAGSLMLQRLRETWSRRRAVAAGLLWGMALGTKYTAALYLALALPLLLWERVAPGAPSRRLRLRRAATVGALALLLVSPWLVRNARDHGNPVHPVGDKLWGRGTLVNESALYEDAGERRSVRDRLLAPLSYSLWNRRADDTLGVLPLALVPILALVPLHRDARRLWLLGLVSALALGFVAAGSVRFQIPALVLVSVPAGQALAEGWARGGWRRPLIGALLVGAGVSNLALLAWHDRELFDPVKVAFGYESEDAWLARMEPSHPLLVKLNQDPSARTVLAISADRLFWLDKPVIASSVLDVSPARDMVRRAGSPEAFARLLSDGHITHVLFAREDFRRDVREGGGRTAWSDSELATLDAFLDHVAIKDARNGQFELYRVP